jgi:hypothetical protein
VSSDPSKSSSSNEVDRVELCDGTGAKQVFNMIGRQDFGALANHSSFTITPPIDCRGVISFGGAPMRALPRRA